MQGLTLSVRGDANDYVGKGLSGATIEVYPPADARFDASENTIIGNTCLYGATSGQLFAAGKAGVRFAVRNSGARAVVEGCGSNGCEYMTGGRIAILGPVGDNFGAGMTGGVAFIWDPESKFADGVNPDAIDWHPMTEMPESYCEEYRKLLVEHLRRTGSERADDLLNEWDQTLSQTLMIVPKEVREQLLGKTGSKKGKKQA